MTGVAVNVTGDPVQDGFVPEVIAIEMDGVTVGLTVIVIAFEVAGFPNTPTRFEVMMQVITCPLVSEEEV